MYSLSSDMLHLMYLDFCFAPIIDFFNSYMQQFSSTEYFGKILNKF